MKFQVSPIKLEAKDRSFEVGGFVLSETFRSARKVIPAHYHEHTNICFVLSGSFIETVGRKPFELSPGSIVFRPAGESHKNQYGARPARSLIIEVGNERMEMIREITDLLDRTAHFKNNSLAAFGHRIQSELRAADKASALVIEGLILEFLAQGVRHNTKSLARKKPPWLRQALDFIHAEFSQSYSLSEVAEISGVHPAHLAKVFRQHFNCTLGEYIRQLRLDYAEKELLKTDKCLCEIALAAGFYDQSHFTNAFKLKFGVTPTEFRLLKKSRKYFPK